MINECLAPIQIDRLYTLGLDFSIEPEPAENMVLSAGADYKVTETESKDSVRFMTMILTVSADLCDQDKQDDVRASANARLLISGSLPYGVEDDLDKVDRYAVVNLLSMAYSHARSLIMNVSAESPMGPLIIPAIIPTAVVDAREADSKSS